MHESSLKTALLQFRLLYLGSLFLLFLVLAFFSYTLEKERLIADETGEMTQYLSHLEEQLKNNQAHYQGFMRISPTSTFDPMHLFQSLTGMQDI
ncbi:MAG: hypothetical protein ACXW33_02950 [Sulfuricurvum sp.]